ncbi:hypothetical protein JTB14_029640 [Gonioctena quinquepunctata]|nr:hypothetical protein JTB14_029640 [Gonioctena quinquepunctata]
MRCDKTGHATGYWSNIFEIYEKRSTEHSDYDFWNMSLAEKASEESINDDTYEAQSKTRHQPITLAVRNVSAVVRVLYFITSSDPESFLQPFHSKYA